MNGTMIVGYRDKTYALDPRSPVNAHYVFMSHAHVDHLYGGVIDNLIASEETVKLARARGFGLPDPISTQEVELLDSGHIVGSRSFLIPDEVFYTGDMALRPRAFLKAPKLPKAKILIIEATYGHKRYSFPSPASVVGEANKALSEMFSRGIPVILCGYALGKAQVLSYLFSSWSPIFVHESVSEMNKVCCSLGVPLNTYKSYSEAEGEGLLERRPWILIAPSSLLKSRMMSSLRKRYGAVTFSFSGWAVDKWFNGMGNIDRPFPLSDHCDYNDLVKVVKKVDPEKVYTVHGYAKEFSQILRRLGYDAQALSGHQSNLIDFNLNSE